MLMVSPAQCSYFTLQKEFVTTLLLHNVKNDKSKKHTGPLMRTITVNDTKNVLLTEFTLIVA